MCVCVCVCAEWYIIAGSVVYTTDSLSLSLCIYMQHVC